MRAAGAILPLDGGGGGGGGGAVDTVNGIAPVAGNVTIGATDIPYTPTFETLASVGNTSTSVGDQLLWGETHTGPASWVWDESTIENGFPVSGGTHTIDRPSLWLAPRFGAPITLTAGSDILAAHPGSIDAFGGVKVVLIGSVAGPLVRGEVLADGLSVLNTSIDPAAEDLQVESLFGRPVGTNNVTLLGFGGATLDDIFGVAAFRGLILFPPAPGARGVVLDGTIGSLTFNYSAAIAAGGVPYSAFTLAATATVAVALRAGQTAFNTLLAGDILFDLSASATVPTTPLPTSTVGLRFVGCEVNGPGSMYNPLGLNAGSIEISSFGHLNGRRSNFIGDWRIDTTGVPPVLVDHTGVGGLPLLIPLDNSQNGGVGGTLRTLTGTASVARHTLISGTVELSTVNLGGSYTGADADYPATQASTSGAGVGAAFTVTLAGGVVTAVVSVDDDGKDYVVGDTVTLTVVGPTETVAAVLDVDEAGWYVRTDGAEGPLTGPARWVAEVARGGGAGSSAVVYVERKIAGVGAWAEVIGTRSSPTLLTTIGQRIGGGAVLDDISQGDRWRLVLINDDAGSPLTEVSIFEILDEGQP